MRLTGGQFKGRRLISPKTHLIRPATDKVREAVFGILRDVEGLSVLDLFAGTGSVAFEALSRGAFPVYLVDGSRESWELIQKNKQLLKTGDEVVLVKGRIPASFQWIEKQHPQAFDLIFIDPPYDKGLVVKSLTALLDYNLVDAQSTIIIEHSPRESVVCQGYELVDHRRYGQTHISFLKKQITEI